jgi:hypothetical protein
MSNQEQDQGPPAPAPYGHDWQHIQGEPQDADPLATSPFQGDLNAELAARPKRARPAGPTLYLAAGLLALVGFIGGVGADRTWGGQAPSAATGPGAAAARGGQAGPAGAGGPQGQGGGRMGGGGMGGGGMGGGGMGGGGMTAGTVQKISGNTVYLRTADGSLVKVVMNGSTKVRTTKNGTVRDLKSGASVVVQGTAGQDGTVTATTVNEGGGMNGGASSPRGG